MPANGPVAARPGAGVARVGTRRTETPPRVAPTARARGGAGAACARSRRSRSRCCVRRRARRACRAEGARDRRTQGASVPVRSSMRPPAASPHTQHGVQCVSRTWRVIVAQAAAVSAGPSSPLSGVGSVSPQTPQQMPRGRRVSEAAATERPYQPVAMVFSCWRSVACDGAPLAVRRPCDVVGVRTNVFQVLLLSGLLHLGGVFWGAARSTAVRGQ